MTMTALRIWGTILSEFLLELILFCVLFFRKAERREKFPLRVLLSLMGVFALALPLSYLYLLCGSAAWGRILIYLLLFAAVTLGAFACLKEELLTVLFVCSMAYAAQNLSYKLFLILWTAGEALRLYDGWGELFDLWYRLLYYPIFALCAAAIYFLFIKRTAARLKTGKLNYRMLAVTVLVLAVTTVLCSFEDTVFAALSSGRENRFSDPLLFAARETGNCFSAVCCIAVLLLASKTIVENELEREVEYLKYAVKQSELQYRMSKDTIDLINVKCHDIKYKLGALSREGVDPAAVEDLKKSISIYDSRIETGNPLLNVLLTEKSLYCEQNGIALSCMIDGEKLSFMEAGDLYCLFGNLLDNALEAVRDISDRRRRVVSLTVKAREGLLLIQQENYFSGDLSFEDGLPVTTKADKSVHGFGTRSIRMIVKSYGGEMAISAADGIFRLNLIFPQQNT